MISRQQSMSGRASKNTARRHIKQVLVDLYARKESNMPSRTTVIPQRSGTAPDDATTTAHFSGCKRIPFRNRYPPALRYIVSRQYPMVPAPNHFPNVRRNAQPRETKNHMYSATARYTRSTDSPQLNGQAAATERLSFHKHRRSDDRRHLSGEPTGRPGDRRKGGTAERSGNRPAVLQQQRIAAFRPVHLWQQKIGPPEKAARTRIWLQFPN